MYPFPKEELPALQMKSFGQTRWHLEILVSKPGIKPMLPAVKAQIPNHWKNQGCTEEEQKSLLNKNINQDKLLAGEAFSRFYLVSIKSAQQDHYLVLNYLQYHYLACLHTSMLNLIQITSKISQLIILLKDSFLSGLSIQIMPLAL